MKVVDAHAGIDDGNNDEDDRNDREKGHRRSSRQVLYKRRCSIHTEELEDEVCHGREEQKLRDVS